MTRILITGASGLLGVNLALEAAKKYEVVGQTHSHSLFDPRFSVLEADLLKAGEIERIMDESRADWLVNCVALANLDACESQPELAQQLNAELPGKLAAQAAKRGMRFLQVSTDAVFDGVKGDYHEEDAPSPISVYGRTKRIAELAVKATHPHVLIVRPNFFGWSVSGDRSLGEFFYNNLASNQTVKGYTDRIFCPLLATDLAAVMLQLLEENARGIYHVVSSDPMSKYDFGLAIADKFGLDRNLIEPTITIETTAPRSLNLMLSTSRVQKILGHRPPTVSEGIERLLEQFHSGYRSHLLAMSPLREKVKG